MHYFIMRLIRRSKLALGDWRFLLMRSVSRYIVGRIFARMLLKLVLRWRASVSFDTQENGFTFFANLNVEKVVATLKTDGVCLGINLPSELVDEILTYAATSTRYGDQDEEMGFSSSERTKAEKKVGRQFAIARYFNTASNCAAIKSLTEDPILWDIATRYLGFKPVFTGVNMWWSYANEELLENQRSKYAQLYHHDVDDYAFLKFFFYLTDVDKLGGPHVCVKGSHNKKKLNYQYSIRRYDDLEIDRDYRSIDVLDILGARGFGFAEDTYCIHKGKPPIKNNRLLLSLCFAAFDYGRMTDVRDPRLLNPILD